MYCRFNHPFATVIVYFFVGYCVCPTIILFPIQLTLHSRVAHRYLGTPSLPNKNSKFLKTVLKSTVGSERVKDNGDTNRVDSATMRGSRRYTGGPGVETETVVGVVHAQLLLVATVVPFGAVAFAGVSKSDFVREHVTNGVIGHGTDWIHGKGEKVRGVWKCVWGGW